MRQPLQMGFEKARPAVADQQRLEDAVTAHCRQIVGVQQRRLGIVQCSVEGDDDTLPVGHGAPA